MNCDQCDLPCIHQAAALEYLLDAKSCLGLAAPPDESVPLENLTRDELLKRAIPDLLLANGLIDKPSDELLFSIVVDLSA